MSERGPFSKRMLILIGAVAVGSLLLGIGLAVFGSKVSRAPISDANSFSESAVGHKAFVELLKKLKIPVVVSQYGSGKKAKDNAVLVLAEPRPFKKDVARGFQLLRDASTSIVILPKWGSRPMPKRKRWIGQAGLLPVKDVQWVAHNILNIDAEVSRSDSIGGFTVNRLGSKAGSVHLNVPQLITSDDLEPVLATANGMLIGKMKDLVDKDVYVLSDPDLIATHGLGKADNAVLAVAMIEHVRQAEATVIFDETIHGFLKKPSVWRALIEFPLVVASLQVLCTLLLLLWAGIGRFGSPQVPEPAIEPGKRFLIDNTAALLQFGGHTSHTLRRYYNSTVRDVARRLHAPELDDAGLEAWLERVGSSKGVKTSLSDVRRDINSVIASKRVQPRSVVLAANRLYHWKQEMLHGAASNPRSR